jgi:hypothetical protein
MHFMIVDRNGSYTTGTVHDHGMVGQQAGVGGDLVVGVDPGGAGGDLG